MNMEKLKISLHYLTPKHILTVMVGCIASAKLGKITTFLIRQFSKFYHINLDEIQGNIEDYKTFNDFFARALKDGARPTDNHPDSIISPADGNISQYGDLLKNAQLQAKGHYFSTDALLGDEKDAVLFDDGKFITVYLSPSDYHRVHMPVDGKLAKMTYIPGEFFSVKPLYTRNIPELLSRNERVVCLFDTAVGKMAVVFVGAMIVRSVTTAWAGIVTPRESRDVYSVDYSKKSLTYTKGEEIGKFTMGSTVICLFEKDKIKFENLTLEDHINMGEAIAKSKK